METDPMVLRHIASLLATLAAAGITLTSSAQDITVGTVVPTKPDGFSQFEKPPGIERSWRPKPPPEMEAATTPDVMFYSLRVEPDKRVPTRYQMEGSRTAFTESAGRSFLVLMKFDLAVANRKPATADFWVSLIFNPASADPKRRDATPRVLDVTPLVLTQEEQDALLDAGWERDAIWTTVDVDASGKVTAVAVESVCADLALPLIESNLQSWKFAPARKGGKPVSAALRLPMHFVRKMERAKSIAPKPAYSLPPVERNTHVASFLLHHDRLDTPNLDELPQTLVATPVLISHDTPGFDARNLFRLHAHVTIDDAGAVTNVDIRDGQSDAVNVMVADCLRSWRFAPPRIDGKPVTARIELVPSAAPVGSIGQDGVLPARRVYRVPADYPVHLIRTSESSVSYSEPPTPRAGMTPDANVRPKFDEKAPPGQPALPDGSSARLLGKGEVSFARRTSSGSIRPDSNSPSLRGLFSTNVRVAMHVDATGAVRGVRIEGAMISTFEAPAAAAVLRQRYVPAYANGVPVDSIQRDVVLFPGASELKTTTIFTDPQPSAGSTPTMDSPPHIARLVLPVFPVTIEKTASRGSATARLHIGPDGSVSSVEILESSRPEFGFALRAAMELCSFAPAEHAGKAVPSTVIRREEFSRTDYVLSLRHLSTLARVLEFDDGSPVAESSTLDKPLAAVLGNKPAYPKSLTSPVPGRVELGLVIDGGGNVRDVEVLSSTDPAFAYAAVQTVSDWLFDGPRRDGRPTTTRARMTVNFAPPAATP